MTIEITTILELTAAVFSILGAFLLSRDLQINPIALYFGFISFFIGNVFMIHLALLEHMAPLLIQLVLFSAGAHLGVISHAKNKEKVKMISYFVLTMTTFSLLYLYFNASADFVFKFSTIEIIAATIAISGNFMMKTHNPLVRINAFYLFIIADAVYVIVAINADLYFFAFQAAFFVFTSTAGILNTRKLLPAKSTDLAMA